MSIATKNRFNKALQSEMARLKKHDFAADLEWEMACNTKEEARKNRFYKNYDQEDFKKLYDRIGQHHGATKAVHTYNHNHEEFKFIVIKRTLKDAYIPDAECEHADCTGNQIIDEINCWEKYANNEEVADLLCPILKYFKSKSDKVTNTSEKMQDNNIIIAQKAKYTGDAEDACQKAEELNAEKGYIGEDAYTRYDKLQKLSDSMGWRDVMWNGGNSGVIFDYATNCYKAVFIDYAL